MGLKIYLNGEFVEKEEARISIFDHGLLYGDGVFEGIRSYGRKVFRLREHMERLYKSAEAIRLKIPMQLGEFMDVVLDTLRANDLDNAYIRVVVTRGEGDLGLDPRKCPRPTIFVIADKIDLYPKEFYEEGLPITIAPTRRNHITALDPRIKSLNYLNNILGRIDAIDAGTEEALMLTTDGYVVECTGDNIFFVNEGRLITPPFELGALEGITHDTIIELAEKRGMRTDFKKLRPEEIFEYEECFLTGTAAELVPVIEIDGKKIGDGRPGEIFRTLLADFRELTADTGVAY